MTRTRQQHLTKDEITTLGDAFRRGISSTLAAGLVNCSTRIATKYYSFFRAGGVHQGEYTNAPEAEARTAYDSLNPWQPHPFRPANVYPDVAHKLRRGCG